MEEEHSVILEFRLRVFKALAQGLGLAGFTEWGKWTSDGRIC